MVEPVSKKPFNYVVAASATKDGQERLRAYYEALGRFIDMFSRVETAMTLTLWHYAKTPPEVAKVVLAGTKIEIGVSHIKKLAADTDTSPEKQADLNYVLQQVGIINGARNDIVHFGAKSIAEGQAIVSNALKARGDERRFPISPTSLDQMTTDLRKIAAHLNYNHLGRPRPHGALGIETLERVLRAPWLYKHPVQQKAPTRAIRSRPSHKRSPKSLRLPRSFRV